MKEKYGFPYAIKRHAACFRSPSNHNSLVVFLNNVRFKNKAHDLSCVFVGHIRRLKQDEYTQIGFLKIQILDAMPFLQSIYSKSGFISAFVAVTYICVGRDFELSFQQAGPEIRQTLVQAERRALVVQIEVGVEICVQAGVLRVQGAEWSQHLLQGALRKAMQVSEEGCRGRREREKSFFTFPLKIS